MTDERMALKALLEKTSDADLLNEMIGFAANRLMALERLSFLQLPLPPPNSIENAQVLARFAFRTIAISNPQRPINGPCVRYFKVAAMVGTPRFNGSGTSGEKCRSRVVARHRRRFLAWQLAELSERRRRRSTRPTGPNTARPARFAIRRPRLSPPKFCLFGSNATANSCSCRPLPRRPSMSSPFAVSQWCDSDAPEMVDER